MKNGKQKKISLAIDDVDVFFFFLLLGRTRWKKVAVIFKIATSVKVEPLSCPSIQLPCPCFVNVLDANKTKVKP